MDDPALSVLIEAAPVEKFCTSFDLYGRARGAILQKALAAIYSGEPTRIADVLTRLHHLRDEHPTVYCELEDDDIRGLWDCLKFATK